MTHPKRCDVPMCWGFPEVVTSEGYLCQLCADRLAVDRRRRES